MTTAPSPAGPREHGLVDRERLDPVIRRGERELGAVGRLDQREERRVALDGGTDVGTPPQEDPGAPVRRPGVEQLPGARRRRVRLVALHREATQRAGPEGVAEPWPDVAPARVRVGRGHAEGHQRRRQPIGRLGRGQRLRHGAHGVTERVVVLDVVIGDDHEHRLVLGSLDGDGRQRDRGGGVAMDRLGQHEGIREPGFGPSARAGGR